MVALFLLSAVLPYQLCYESMFGEAFYIQISRKARRGGSKLINRLDLHKVRFADGRTDDARVH